jgi:hypothetical protein
MYVLQALALVSPSKALIVLRKAISALLLAMVCANAWCQANPPQEGNSESKQERKQDLRSTVRQQMTAGNLAKPGDKIVSNDSGATNARQLNSVERTELRRQLASDPRGQRSNVAAVEQR